MILQNARCNSKESRHFVTIILGAFEKLRKATSSCVMSVSLSVCPSVHTELLGSHWLDFHENLIF